MSLTPPEAGSNPGTEPEPDEFYFDGPFMVFTEQYHLRRGYCCQSGCRHCPYGYAAEEDSAGGSGPEA